MADPPAADQGPTPPESVPQANNATEAAPNSSGAPPPVAEVDRQWNAPDSAAQRNGGEARTGVDDEQDSSEDAPEPLDLHRHFAVGLQAFAVENKAMAGAQLRFGGGWFWVHLEASPTWLLERSPDLDGVFVGTAFGGYVALSPWNTETVEVHGGLGTDVYWLSAVNMEQAELALSTRASLHWWPWRTLGFMGTVRSYPFATDGLELGVDRARNETIPVLFSLGFEWRPR